MNKIKKVAFLAIAIYFSLLFASHEVTSRELIQLKNIKKVMIVVKKLDSKLENSGLTSDQIKTDVELKLRLAGINVFSSQKEPTHPYLYVVITTYQPSDPNLSYLLAFNGRLELHQLVVLTDAKGDPILITTTKGGKLSISASTWEANVTGIIDNRNTAGIRDMVKDLVDLFLNDYLSANPKGEK
jgi:hypothetical protein